MNYIVLDLEWNQSPRGKAGEKKGLPFEIVEIGAVKLDEELNLIGRFSELVRPSVYKKLHYKTKEILQIDIKELEAASCFKDVIKRFFDWCGGDYMMCTWGSMDLTELQRNMSFFHCKNPLPRPLLYYDVQKLYSIAFDDGKSRRSLKDAVDELDIPENAAFHAAIDDTLYTAKVMRHMDIEAVKQYVSVDYYRLPETKEEELHIVFDDYAKDVSRAFDSREQVMADKGITQCRCYLCGRALRKKVRWFSTNGKIYLSVSVCPEHGYMKGKIRIKKAEQGGVFAIKTLKFISEEDMELIRQKKKAAEKRERAEKITQTEA